MTFWRVSLLCLVFTVGSFAATCAGNVNPEGTLSGNVALADQTGCLSGSPADPNGFNFNPDPGPWSDIVLAWAITQNPNGTYHYEYTFTDLEGSTRGLSHIIIGLSDNCTFDNGCILNYPNGFPDNSTIDTFDGDDPSNPGLPDGYELYGIKINFSPSGTNTTFSFDSNRIPVWQNVYLKDGNFDTTPGEQGGQEDVWAYNAGWTDSANRPFFLAAPDTVVPEPGFYGLLATGLAGLYVIVRRRRTSA